MFSGVSFDRVRRVIDNVPSFVLPYILTLLERYFYPSFGTKPQQVPKVINFRKTIGDPMRHRSSSFPSRTLRGLGPLDPSQYTR